MVLTLSLVPTGLLGGSGGGCPACFFSVSFTPATCPFPSAGLGGTGGGCRGALGDEEEAGGVDSRVKVYNANKMLSDVREYFALQGDERRTPIKKHSLRKTMEQSVINIGYAQVKLGFS